MPVPVLTACALAALALLAGIARPAYRQTAGWFALAALGQGVSLALIDAGPLPRYQHYPPLDQLARERPWLLAVLAVQALTVGAAWIARARAGALAPVRGRARRLSAAVALSALTAATVSPDVWRFLAELAFAAAVQTLALFTIALAAWHWPVSGATRDAGDATPARAGWPVWTAAATAVVLSYGLTVAAYERHPHIPDEVVYLHHAKYLAAGLFEMPAPPVPAAFEVDLMEYESARWYSPVPPGWPAVLALATWAGMPWLLNPLLAGLNVVLSFLLLARVYDPRTARLAATLLALSPGFLFLAMSVMPHQWGLTGALVAFLGVARARGDGHWRWGVLAGIGVGVTSLVRPLDGVIVGGLALLWALGAGGARLRLAPLAGLCAATVLTGALVFPYNQALTGDPLKFPINEYVNRHHAPGANDYGFGANRGLGWAIDPNPGHSPVDGIINANLNAFSLNTDLFGWAGGSLLLVWWLLCSGGWRRADSVMAALVAGFVLAYFPYYFSGGPDFGARYWFPAIVGLVALSARGLEELRRFLGTRAVVAAALSACLMLAVYLPWRAVDKYHEYRGMRPDIRRLAEAHGFGADLVLIRGRRFPDYASAFAFNPVDLTRATPVYAWDRDADTRHAVLRAYSDRNVWIVEGPSVTGDGFRIALGPVSAASLLEQGKLP